MTQISHYTPLRPNVKKGAKNKGLRAPNLPVGMAKVPKTGSLAPRVPVQGRALGLSLLSTVFPLRFLLLPADKSLFGMISTERRGTERLFLPVPIRVMPSGAADGCSSEDTHAIEINQAGARIPLGRRVVPGDMLRIVNLKNQSEAEFRVLGPNRLDRGHFAEWGAVCLNQNRNIWGIEFSPPITSAESQAGALLRCRECASERLTVLNFTDLEALDATGTTQRSCRQCSRVSTWAYADEPRHSQPVPSSEIIDTSLASNNGEAGLEKRSSKRLALKLPILVETDKGRREIRRTENVSKDGIAVLLGILLAVGENVKVACPYTGGGHRPERKIEVHRRTIFKAGERWLYGLRFIR